MFTDTNSFAIKFKSNLLVFCLCTYNRNRLLSLQGLMVLCKNVLLYFTFPVTAATAEWSFVGLEGENTDGLASDLLNLSLSIFSICMANAGYLRDYLSIFSCQTSEWSQSVKFPHQNFLLYGWLIRSKITDRGNNSKCKYLSSHCGYQKLCQVKHCNGFNAF